MSPASPSRASRLLTAVTLALALLGTEGCLSAARGVERERPPSVTVAPFAQRKASAEAPTPRAHVAGRTWWADFRDPALTTLVERSLAGNYQLRTALYRNEEEPLTDVPRLYPEVGVQGAILRTRVSSFLSTGVETDEYTQYNLGLRATYRVDLWGEGIAQSGSLKQRVEIRRDDSEIVARDITFQVGEAWFTVLEQRSLATLVREQAARCEALLARLEERAGAAAASPLDVAQQRLQCSGIRARLVLAERQGELSQNTLSTLLGERAGADFFADRAALPELPPRPPLGTPEQLVMERPDVRRHQARVAEADYRLTAAIAERLPNVTVGAGGGFQSFRADGLFSSPLVYDLGLQLNFPIFDGGVRAAEMERLELVVKRRQLMYDEAYLRASNEVQAALLDEDRTGQLVKSLDEEIATAQATVALASARYERGGSEFIQVVVASRALLELQRSRVNAQRQLLSARLALYRALGTGWTRQISGR